MMTVEERKAAGIKEALEKRGGELDQSMTYWIEYRVPEDATREKFFIDETLAGAGNSTSVLMLLGDMHVEFVAEELNKMGHKVITNHDLVPIKTWKNRL